MGTFNLEVLIELAMVLRNAGQARHKIISYLKWYNGIDSEKPDYAEQFDELIFNAADDVREWVCPSCDTTLERTYNELAECGSPYCPECEQEMELP